MSFQYPLMIVVAVVVAIGLGLAYRYLNRQRGNALAAAGFTRAGSGAAATTARRGSVGWARTGWRRHAPPVVFLAALTLLLLGAARPQATVKIPHAVGTVIMAFDVSNSMSATDVKPSRLGAAQAAATGFVQAQPDSVHIGLVAFDQGAITTHLPSGDHPSAIAAIARLKTAGGTSLGQAILASLTIITGKPVSLPDPNSDAAVPKLGYWGSATIVLLSDGEDTGGPDALAAAALAADAGVHIETIGVGTVDGATITVDGYQVATSLDEDVLTQIAQTTTGSYHRATDAAALNQVYRTLDLRVTSTPEFLELTGVVVALAILLLLIGGVLMVIWYGRIL